MHKKIIVTLVVLTSFVAGFFMGNKDRALADEYWFSQETSSIKTEDFELFWKALTVLDKKHPDASSISSEDRVWAAIQGLTESYGDPYTTFFTPEETENFEESINGTFSGVGMEVGLQDGYVTVIAPLKNSPAELAGILPGDVITKINDENALEMSVDQAVEKIRGPKGEMVTLSLAREGAGELIVVEILRDTIELVAVETSIAEENSNVFVISLYNFTEDIEVEFEAALKEFIASGKKKLVLDMRSNPGGFLSSSIDVASFFVPQGKVIVTESFSEDSERENIEYRSKGTTLKFPKNFEMVVLVDGGSASASEIVAGALQEYKIAKLVGTKTFGKGSVQEYIRLGEDTALKITVAHWLTPLGNSISQNGLTPDVDVPYDEDITQDNQLEAAIELLLQ